MAEALQESQIPPEPPEQAGRSLYERLQIASMAKQLSRRVKDLGKNLEGCRHELEVLREMATIVSETKMFKLQTSIDNNTRNLCALQESNQRARSVMM